MFLDAGVQALTTSDEVVQILEMNESIRIPTERIEKAIYLIRGERVMLDRDLAALYEVETRVLNRPCAVTWSDSPPISN